MSAGEMGSLTVGEIIARYNAALATARAEARREAFEEAASIAAALGGVKLDHECADTCAAALRAKAGEGDPK